MIIGTFYWQLKIIFAYKNVFSFIGLFKNLISFLINDNSIILIQLRSKGQQPWKPLTSERRCHPKQKWGLDFEPCGIQFSNIYISPVTYIIICQQQFQWNHNWTFFTADDARWLFVQNISVNKRLVNNLLCKSFKRKDTKMYVR